MSTTVTHYLVVEIPIDQHTLEGILQVPNDAQGLVVFVHGSGSSRHSSRNQYVAHLLQRGGLAVLLFDLLTAAEEQIDLRTRHLRFDIGLLATRVITAIDWLVQRSEIQHLPIGCFGASTGAAAALIAAAARPQVVRAVVSRGGRPDLAENVLPSVRAPTLLIVGGDDTPVIAMNQHALDRLQTVKELAIVPGATHLFEEPGAMQAVTQLAQGWFVQHLVQEER
jgi:putative phosphoribosyl transferase